MPITIQDIAAGGQAAEQLLTSPERIAAQKAEYKGVAEQTPYKTELMRISAAEKGLELKGTEEYMKRIAAGDSPEEATASLEGAAAPYSIGEGVGEMVNTNKELASRKQELSKEEYSLKALPPGHPGRANIENNITRRQKEIDTLETKQLASANKVLGEHVALLNTITDEASLQGARQYEAQELSKLADQQKIPPENKAQFIKEHSRLPLKYDGSGQAQIETERTKNMSVADQLKQRNLERQEARDADKAKKEAEDTRIRQKAEQRRQEHQDVIASRQTETERKKADTDSFRANKELLDSYNKQYHDNLSQAARYTDEQGLLKAAGGDPVRLKNLQSKAEHYEALAQEALDGANEIQNSMKARGQSVPKEGIEKAAKLPSSFGGHSRPSGWSGDKWKQYIQSQSGK